MLNELLSIGEAAKLLGVSIDTLRRWDSAGRLTSVRSGPRGHRFYRQSDIDKYLQEIDVIARNWVEAINPLEPESDAYSQTRDVFQSRLEQFQLKLSHIASLDAVSLITAVSGEIGNNSFDHNLGNWPDIPGIYFSYAIRNRKVVLADRGQGILTTLKRVRTELTSSSEALKVAFTETLSGRYPESRGNGLKFVRSIIVNNPFSLYFQTGDADLCLKYGDNDVIVHQAKTFVRGCLVVISFEGLL
ncbi:helix-turn-helix domain-containing protein [Patescibacteria group bacterium]|nr:helix-turn-helix domain-containing protein [Patescibacteria group bacterium]MBU1473028.1 helix-turn-helix domain-containing protein [Patescibacteria group bacterium]